ncbi:MAG: 4-hydroxy-3-methylbut-2-enyl diphosphate reductase [Dehalococcoidia bacterium]|nr:4-hydroxy-3-methylbut-2-enyl diphosphate reductase [Dehalococcoidia bacterium]
MQITKAEETGFCFGVKRALRTLEQAAQKYGEVETVGPVVHNQQVVDQFTRLGVRVVASADDVKGGVAVIPSHGLPPQESDKLKSRNLTVIDTTCPNVHRAQLAAKRLSEEGFWLVVFGDPIHPEVKAILGWANQQGMATLRSSDVCALVKVPKRIGVLSQTTRNEAEFTKFVNDLVPVLLPKVQELGVLNTLCHVTKRRQAAALELARNVDLMIVVGGRNSANTRILAEICASAGTETHHIESAREIRRNWLKRGSSVGVTSGTSIPDDVIEEVMIKLENTKRGLRKG